MVKANLITPKQYYADEKTKPLIINEISTLKDIGSFHVQKLNEIGILTLGDLLRKCSSEIKLLDLATKLGISVKKLQKWVVLAKEIS